MHDSFLAMAKTTLSDGSNNLLGGMHKLVLEGWGEIKG